MEPDEEEGEEEFTEEPESSPIFSPIILKKKNVMQMTHEKVLSWGLMKQGEALF